MLDDADFHDFGYSSVDAITPEIDALAAEGMTFDNYYAASGICSPTRVSMLTGDSPIHYGLNRLWPDLRAPTDEQLHWALRGIPDYEETIGEAMKGMGYRTFHLGKWHVGNSKEVFKPSAKGFDRYLIQRAVPYEGVLNTDTESGFGTTEPQVWRATYHANLIIEEIRNAVLTDNETLYINWWPLIPHLPLYVPPTFTDSMNALLWF